MTEVQLVEVRCPVCKRFLGETRDYARLVCGECGCEVTYKSRDERRRVLTVRAGGRGEVETK